MFNRKEIDKSIRIVRDLADNTRCGRPWSSLYSEEREIINAAETLIEYVEECLLKEEDD